MTTLLSADHPLSRHCRQILSGICGRPVPGEFLVTRLPASRPVFLFSAGDGTPLLVGKFYAAFPPHTAADQSLAAECRSYEEMCSWGGPGGRIPRSFSPAPELKLGLLLEYVPGPTLDEFLARSRESVAAAEALTARLVRLAHLLAWFHRGPVLPAPVSFRPAGSYLHKLGAQLQARGLLDSEGIKRLEQALPAWGRRFAAWPEPQVLLHGDATPTNFLFPDGGAVAVDLERLRSGDRLFDVGWVMGELRHAFAWRFGDPAAAGPVIAAFLTAYREAVAAEAALLDRLEGLSPLYMALALWRIARNSYLAWDYRRYLVAEGLALLTSP